MHPMVAFAFLLCLTTEFVKKEYFLTEPYADQAAVLPMKHP